MTDATENTSFHHYSIVTWRHCSSGRDVSWRVPLLRINAPLSRYLVAVEMCLEMLHRNGSLCWLHNSVSQLKYDSIIFAVFPAFIPESKMYFHNPVPTHLQSMYFPSDSVSHPSPRCISPPNNRFVKKKIKCKHIKINLLLMLYFSIL
jgi:hypothetical protein